MHILNLMFYVAYGGILYIYLSENRDAVLIIYSDLIFCVGTFCNILKTIQY